MVFVRLVRVVLVFKALLRGPKVKPVKVRVNTNLSRERAEGELLRAFTMYKGRRI